MAVQRTHNCHAVTEGVDASGPKHSQSQPQPQQQQKRPVLAVKRDSRKFTYHSSMSSMKKDRPNLITVLINTCVRALVPFHPSVLPQVPYTAEALSSM
jgi:hypothetical protein